VTLAANWYADDGRVALHTGRAVALRTMESDSTERVRSTLIATKDARIQTLSSDTGSIGRTIIIHNAFRSETVFFRVTSPTIRTEANGSVLLSTTNGVLSTNGSTHDTRVLADKLFASLVEGAVSVGSTLNIRFRNLIAVNVGISSKIFWALALGFMTNDGTQGVI